jgi:hypothetical protein
MRKALRESDYLRILKDYQTSYGNLYGKVMCDKFYLLDVTSIIERWFKNKYNFIALIIEIFVASGIRLKNIKREK